MSGSRSSRPRPAWLYRLTVRAAGAAAPLAARFDAKIARGLTARRGVLARLATWAAAHRDPQRPLVWVHAPSVGEGLQAKPVLETLRAERPDWQLAYTHFSPSAERLASHLPVDVHDYLPMDRPADVRAALEALQPTALVFSKLDVWPELTLAAARRGARLGLISATVAPDSSRLKWPTRVWAAPAYAALDRIGAISEDDAERLAELGARRERVSVTGDTRYDSVAERAERLDRGREPLARLGEPGSASPLTIVAGSTWPPDETVLLGAFADALVQVPRARLVLAPHEPHPDHLAGIALTCKSLGLSRPVRLSQLEHDTAGAVIVVDRVGVLADLYAVGDVAYVGGGFHRAGLHSVLEPAVFGVPVIVGPDWRNSRDADLLLERGGAVALPRDGRATLHAQWLTWHHDPAARRRAGAAARGVVLAGRGASERTTALVRELVDPPAAPGAPPPPALAG
jgi:3-deoxy-D-manno-octulosonic-acid transferase